MKNKIVIHGSQYKDNFGDTLLVKVIKDKLDVNFDVYSSTASPKVRQDLNIKKANLFDIIFSPYFIYGGGGYFGQPNNNINRWSKRFIIRHGLVGILRRLICKKYIFLGTGFGPLTYPAASLVAKFILNGADSINLRDKESINYASELVNGAKLNETADLVPSYISNKHKKSPHANKLILHLHIPKNDHKKLNYILQNFIAFKNKNFQNYLIEVISDSENDENQTWFFDIIKNDYPEMITSTYQNFETTIEIIKNSIFVVTNKLHVAIVAASMQIPVASIYMHNKTQRFFEQLNRPESAIPLDSLNESNDLASFFETSYNNGLDLKHLEKLITKSNMNLLTLEKWLSNE
ncbi:polysaccharide pyruvyl transferase family protein [Providencia rettgeri]|uniref:polysaccharide pyruvyl transferase family protein n=1 Tax=Providencia rettgeri TaxID=587 RepID=UPI00235F07B1|nr:polysaccharide pyruvyl transferase family protein [Providencia rettgeri]